VLFSSFFVAADKSLNLVEFFYRSPEGAFKKDHNFKLFTLDWLKAAGLAISRFQRAFPKKAFKVGPGPKSRLQRSHYPQGRRSLAAKKLSKSPPRLSAEGQFWLHEPA
jgi:hypothetical protein